jgi:hypothetical protein
VAKLARRAVGQATFGTRVVVEADIYFEEQKNTQ